MIARSHKKPKRNAAGIALLLACCLAGLFANSCSEPEERTESNTPKPAPITATTPVSAANTQTNANKALAEQELNDVPPATFRHNNQIHSQLSCNVCHRRSGNAARIGFPGRDEHMPCIGCHTQQFEDPRNPICGICHSDIEKGSLRSFPGLRSFGARFDHAAHLRSANCATCHKPVSGGVAKSIPLGANAHATCFQCHSASSSERMSTCGTCHQPGRGRLTASVRVKAYSVSFSHGKHAMNCAVCHQVQRGSITAPLASMHMAPAGRKSCASCHDNTKAFGGDDFSDCKRCHLGENDFRFRRLF